MSKKKDLTDTDRALFKAATEGVKPLKHDKVHFTPTKKPPRKQIQAPTPEIPTVQLSQPQEFFIEAEDTLSFTRPGVQPKALKSLKSGKTHIDASLDLHGKTLDCAENAVITFINSCHNQGLRCVRIVHGKGFQSGTRYPKLKNHINHWLPQLENILAFHSCPPNLGGRGAVLVLLSRKN